MIFVSGIPATGKTRVCQELSATQGFAHYDMERFPGGWPLPWLHPVWSRSRTQFVNQLCASHGRVALDWGFPPIMLQWVLELQGAGARVIWFTGDVAAARIIYQQRDDRPVEWFDNQVAEIQSRGLPKPLGARVVNALDNNGALRSMSEIIDDIFIA